MTLRRQILGVISLVFLGILVGLLVFSVRGTRDYLQQQLASHAQDAATALSLPLAQSMGRDDMVLVELNVASVFDRGFFKRVVVTDAKGKVLVERELPDKVAEVPVGERCWHFSFTPDERQVLLTCGRSKETLVIDTASWQVTQKLPTQGMSWGVLTWPKAMGSLDQP